MLVQKIVLTHFSLLLLPTTVFSGALFNFGTRMLTQGSTPLPSPTVIPPPEIRNIPSNRIRTVQTSFIDISSNLVLGSKFSGFEKIKYLHVFGDSYTTIHYDIDSSPRPLLVNPLGVQWPGLGSANGPTWSAYLTSLLNNSQLLTFNMAVGGATVDRKVVSPSPGLIKTFREQVSRWKSKWKTDAQWRTKYYPWKGEDSVFGIWFGINDIWRSVSWTKSTPTARSETILRSYWEAVQELYLEGGRNFVIFNVPTMEDTPEVRNLTALERENVREYTETFNSALLSKALTWHASLPVTKRSEVSIWYINVHTLFRYLAIHAPSYGFWNTTGWCPQYSAFQYTDLVNNLWENRLDERCRVKVRRWFWIDPWHPTSRVHEELARVVAEALQDWR